MTTNLVPAAPAVPVVENAFARLAEIQKTGLVQQEMEGFDLRFDRITIPSGGSTFFEVPTVDKIESVSELSGVVLYHHPMRSYYEKPYSGGKERPECYSLDSKKGVGDPGGRCADCLYNTFGTGINNSKGCKEKRRIYLLREGEIFPLMLDLPTGSLRDFGIYVQRLLSHGLAPKNVITRFTLQKASNSVGQVYSQGVYGMVRTLTPEEVELTERLAKEVTEYATSRMLIPDDPEAVDYAMDAVNYAADVDSIPAFDPETGEVFEDAAGL